jgi:AraC family transcriptional regulator of adaptative response/methylated-DNA-[protein]-cysteine methyltransferase
MAATNARDDVRWKALRERDAGADGTFVYAVRTTGVYCRPSCAARPARPENVTFYGTPDEAEHAGYRACKRCKPRLPPLAERRARLVADVCRLMDDDEEPRTLEALAARVKVSAFHLHRIFKQATGLTPKAYAAARRAERMKGELLAAGSVTEAIYRAGFGSAGRFYAQAPRRLGMTPTAFRAGGADEEIRFAVGSSSLGLVLVAATARGICAVLFGASHEGLRRDLARRFPRADLVPADGEFASTVAEVVRIIERPGEPSRLPLDIRGTSFQERVWRALIRIPAGETTSYGELARTLGKPTAARAVARACAANHLAVAVPCHRVVGEDGSVRGYRWGTARKKALLAREAKS